METLFIGYNNGLVRALVNGQVDAAWALEGDAPVAQIAVDPLAHERMYAATLGAGLWRSDDAGRTFTRLSGIPNELVWSVAVSATDRNDGYGTVYAGTQPSAPPITPNTVSEQPVTAPSLPISESQQQQLQALLLQYEANQITPAQYQAERAKILAGQ